MKRRTKAHDQEPEPPLLTRAEARRFFRVTNATLDRWLEKGKLQEAFSVPSAPPRRPTPVVLYSVCDGELRTKLARKLVERDGGELLAVQLLPEQIQAEVQAEVQAARKMPAPRAHKRRPHPGRSAVLEMQGLFHRLAARAEAELGTGVEAGLGNGSAAVPASPATAATGPVPTEPAGDPPRDSGPTTAAAPASPPQVAPQVAPQVPGSSFAAESEPDPSVTDVDEPGATGPAEGTEFEIELELESKPSAVGVATAGEGAAPAAAPVPVPVVAAAAQAIATLMASDAELAMLFGDQGQAQTVGQLQAPEDSGYSARPPSGTELLRSLTDQISGLRNELLWKDRQVATELAELRQRTARAEVAEPSPPPRTHRTALTSPSLLAGGIALLLLWPFVLWLRCGDLYWALAALVFANLAACISLLCARVRA